MIKQIMPVNYDQVIKLLPQGYPFIFIDRIEANETGEVFAYKNITHGDYLAVDMETKRLVFPPSLIVEAMGQATVALTVKNPEIYNADHVWLAGGALEIEFFRNVYPGDRLVFKNIISKIISTGAIMTSVAMVDGEIVAKGTLFSIIKPKAETINE
jgi:3-hydroxymyristoyl/3-hydroxydecanoyl-(acyl carrier protein) dehydratase